MKNKIIILLVIVIILLLALVVYINVNFKTKYNFNSSEIVIKSHNKSISITNKDKINNIIKIIKNIKVNYNEILNNKQNIGGAVEVVLNNDTTIVFDVTNDGYIKIKNSNSESIVWSTEFKDYMVNILFENKLL